LLTGSLFNSLVAYIHLHKEMFKFESSQKDESRTQSVDS